MINLHTLVMNLKREFWENHRMLITLPIIISGLMILAAIGAVIYSNNASDLGNKIEQSITSSVSESPEVSVRGKNPEEAKQESETDGESNTTESKDKGSDFWFMGIYFALTWFVAIFYLLSSLHTDRRDKSILFWKSMPVSELETVVSKYIFASLAFALFAMLIAWGNAIILYGLVATGMNPDLVDPTGEEMAFNFAQMFVWPLLVIGITWLWSSMWFSWALFCSARAKRFPILLFILVPLIFRVLELIFTRQSSVFSFLLEHTPWTLLSVMSKEPSLGDFLHYVFVQNGGGLIASLIFSAVFIYGAVWYRTHQFEGD